MEVFRQEPGPVCRVGDVASLGLSLPLAPPPASYLQRGWGGSSLEFLSPFVLRTACGVFQPVNFSLALPQFKKSLTPTALRAFWPVPTLCNAAGSSPFCPLLLAAGAGVGGIFLLGVAFRHIMWALFNFSSWLGCPPRFESFPRTRQREGFLVVGNFLY